MIIAVIVLIGVLSVLLSLWSLRGMLKHPEVKEAQKDLSTNRVVFQDSSSLDSSSSIS